MHKPIVWVIVVVVTLAIMAGFYFYYQAQKQQYLNTIPAGLEEIDDVVSDAINKSTSSVKNTGVDVNPIEKTNPFSQTYQNPFE